MDLGMQEESVLLGKQRAGSFVEGVRVFRSLEQALDVLAGLVTPRLP
ncbi:MAG: hypothetical protein ACI8QC_002186 [Planctomycetota bacterium]|jgi:hypothetical protein